MSVIVIGVFQEDKMATFNYLTHLLLILLLVNVLPALGDFLDDEEQPNNDQPANDDSTNNATADNKADVNDKYPDFTKPAIIEENPNPAAVVNNENNQPANDGSANDANNDDSADDNADSAKDEKPEDAAKVNPQEVYNQENPNTEEKVLDDNGSNTTGQKPRFLDSEEVEEEEKVAIKPPDENMEEPSPKNASQTSDKPNQASPPRSKPQQYSFFNQQQYVTSQVSIIFSNNPNNIPLILSYANQGDIEHKLTVFKALRTILKDRKNVDITGRIAVMREIEANVLVNPGITPNQRSDAEILKRQFYKMVYDQQTEEIKNAINNRIPMNTPRYVFNSKTILDYSEILCLKILQRSIKELYNASAENFKNLIQGVSNLPYVTETIHGFRTIFDQMDARNDWNLRHKDVFLLAKALRSKEYLPTFMAVSETARLSFQYMKQNLPYSLKNLVWAQNRICLKNLDTYKYLYPANLTKSPMISTVHSLFLTNPAPQEGIWSIFEKSGHYQIFNLFYGRYVASEEERKSGENYDSKQQTANRDPDNCEIIPYDDAILIKNVKTKKFLKEIGANERNINKVSPVNSEAITEKFLWIVEDCGYNMMKRYDPIMNYNQIMPFGYYY